MVKHLLSIFWQCQVNGEAFVTFVNVKSSYPKWKYLLWDNSILFWNDYIPYPIFSLFFMINNDGLRAYLVGAVICHV
jgi:hypothetical protein